jgi:hypothetical protein
MRSVVFHMAWYEISFKITVEMSYSNKVGNGEIPRIKFHKNHFLQQFSSCYMRTEEWIGQAVLIGA